jgi:hypothetical protein
MIEKLIRYYIENLTFYAIIFLHYKTLNDLYELLDEFKISKKIRNVIQA